MATKLLSQTSATVNINIIVIGDKKNTFHSNKTENLCSDYCYDNVKQ